jgi:hypothetical protein
MMIWKGNAALAAVWIGVLLGVMSTTANAQMVDASTVSERKPISGMISSLFGGIKDAFVANNNKMAKEADVGERGLMDDEERGLTDAEKAQDAQAEDALVNTSSRMENEESHREVLTKWLGDSQAEDAGITNEVRTIVRFLSCRTLCSTISDILSDCISFHLLLLQGASLGD